ncbi:uncharacterized protein si:ch211-207l14.1 isoform X1 [Betta splendens]|uniref:Uncharacterized protein si:ch211-207l14.1 isoform X1 n=1 Tax=Betta splendens TaxID=158456 RepID=A0A6P7L806_BETSP|nr:uncharacterized protein si:ch211-207l14.1 isoform X1 [Betta splendens]XP_028990622.1 uncharacterized protein si:ch211-207l14.1 isoform X1 [Betta splendens]
MNSDEAEVFSDTEDLSLFRGEEKGGEEEVDDEDPRVFSAWVRLYKGGRQQTNSGEEEEDRVTEGQQANSRTSSEESVPSRSDHRASLPCPATLSAMQLSRLHSSTCAPVTAKVLLRRSSSRRLPLLPQDVPAPSLERRPSLIPTIPEALPPERRMQFRRRNVMSLSDADTVCLMCHNNLNVGAGGIRELQCTHSFHRECIEEWLWRKQSCPTCHVQLSMSKPVYWSSTRVKVP